MDTLLVVDVVEMNLAGSTNEDIQKELQLTPEEVQEALNYYKKHRMEIDTYLREEA